MVYAWLVDPSYFVISYKCVSINMFPQPKKSDAEDGDEESQSIEEELLLLGR